MVTLVNRAKVTTATTGTGTITLGSAESGYQSFADAGVSDGDVVRYAIEDGDDWEIGSGTYTASGTTLSRTVDESSNSDAALNLTGSAVVFITAAAEDVFQGELFAENYDGTSTKPSATGTNAVAIGKNATATQGSNISVGASSDATGTLSSSFGIAADSAGGYSTALGYASGTSPLGSYSLAAGASAQTAGTYAVALPNSYASGNTSFAAAIGNNMSSYGALTANSIAMGALCKSTNSTKTVSIGYQNIAEGDSSSAVGGRSNQVSAQYGSITGGFGNYITINGLAARVGGYQAKAEVRGKDAYSSGAFSSAGDAQTATIVLRKATTDATASVLTASGGTGGIGNQIVLPNNSAFAFHGTIVARQQASAGTASAAWKVEGLIRREGSAGTTVLVNSATTVLDNTPGWGMALSADTTNGGLKVEATGAASTNIRWVATIHTSEVTYA